MNLTVNILLVDDEVLNLEVLESFLQSPDYHLIRALTAEEALLQLLDGDFAAIVLDVHMPRMNGIELANLIKQRKRTQHIPIIFLTAYFHEDRYVLEGYGTGAVDYLTKPVNPQILKSKIGVFADLFRKTRAVAETNAALELEITQRQNAEEALRQANSELEARVQERTADLKRAQSILLTHASELEVQVAERTAELREKIGELEAFSYSLSHDLRSPLRAMQGFAQLLLEDNADKLDPHSLRYLQGINDSAARMDALISDVLTHARLMRSDIKLQPVNLDEFVPQIVSNYPQLQESGAEIEIQSPLPTVLANEASLMQCLSNLLSNAVKFVAPGVRPHVRVRSDEFDGARRLWIEDNGIGIAAADQPRIWDMFARLGRAGDYEGTGIGLAIVRKAVERMNGQIGLESAIGQGSKFWLRLPKA